jgi:biotin transporter BioY
MGLLELFVIAVGLSMDAFAVSICKGLSVRELKPKHALTVGVYFGGFQMLMPLIGFALGVRFQSFITSIDHWIAFVLLGLIGLPIFTEGGGLMYLAKPSCGFLLGLPLMAMVIGLLTRDLKASTLRGHAVRGMLRIALACVAGLAVLYLIGLPYMYFVLAGKWSIQKTIVSGCLIFLPFDALKIVVTTLLCVRLLPVLRRD